MSAPVILELICPQCAATMHPTDVSCAKCGYVGAESPNGSSFGQEKNSLQNLVDNRWAMLGILFLVLAGLGLPWLWKSRAFSHAGKIVLTIVVLIYTALLIWLLVIALHQIVNQVQAIREAW